MNLLNKLILSGLAAGSLVSPRGFAAIALVSHTTAAGSGAQTTPAINTTGATLLLIVTGGFQGTPCAYTISDSKGNTWTCSVQDIGTNQRAGIWCAANPAVGSGHTATINGSTVGSSFSAWSGTATTCADVTNHASCANCTSLQPGSVTPAQNNELVITAVATLPAGGTWTIASGFTVLDQVAASSGVNDGVMVDYQIQTTATAANPIWTGGSEDTGAVIATFKMATASIPVVTHKPIWQ